MSGRGWHIVRDAGTLTLCRRLPPRFDVMAETRLPGGAPLRLAHQIRQDMWRLAKRVRGFSPVVRLTPDGCGWQVAAGGAVIGPVAPGLAEDIATLLEDRATRRRWLRAAGHVAEAAQ